MKRLVRWIALSLFCAVIGAGVAPVYADVISPDEWIAESNQILKTDPQDAKAYFNRGTGYFEKGEYDAAIADLSRAIAIEPNAPDVYFNRGASYRRQHKIDAAISDFSKAIELNQTQSGYYFERCNARIVKNDFEGAIADSSIAIKLSPEDPQLYFMRGLAFMLSGYIDAALSDSVRALQMNPGYMDARRLLYETILRRDEFEQSVYPISPHLPVLEQRSIETADGNPSGKGEIG